MTYDLNNVALSFVSWLMGLYHSPLFIVIKILAGVYLAVLFADIIMLLILRDIPQHIRTGLRGTDLPVTTKSKMKKRWEQVRLLLQGQNESQLKLAIIEADAIADEVLAGIGYKGANMTEKLQQVGQAHLDDHLEALKGAHEVRNKIVHQADFQVDDRLARTVVGVYENFLKYLEFLD